MKYAIVLPADQTIAYVASEDGDEITIKHPNAFLWDNRAEAEKILAIQEERVRKHWAEQGWPWPADGYHQIEEVPNEAEFRSREDTW